MENGEAPRPLLWLGDSKARYQEFPPKVQREMGYAFFLAQTGGRHRTIEVRENSASGTYRAVYTVRYIDVVYVLHAFQKKSKTGAKTPKPDLELIEKRLKALIAERERQ
jgi:phage-related protein